MAPPSGQENDMNWYENPVPNCGRPARLVSQAGCNLGICATRFSGPPQLLNCSRCSALTRTDYSICVFFLEDNAPSLFISRESLALSGFDQKTPNLPHRSSVLTLAKNKARFTK